MKKMLCLFLAILISCIAFCSCDKSAASGENEDLSAGDFENSDILTEEEAEEIAAAQLYQWIKNIPNILTYLEWAPSETRYSIGAVERTSSGYIVNGKYSTYDKYGNYDDTYSFTVVVEDDGSADLIDAGDETLNDWVGGIY